MRSLPGAGLRRADAACAWLHDKFGVELSPDEVRELEPAKFIELAHERAIAAYDERESEYPVLAGLYRFSARGAGGQQQGFLREELVEWAKRRFDAELDRRRPQEQAARGNPRAAGRAQPAATTSRPTRSPPRRSSASTQLFADEPSATATLGAVTGHNGKLDDLTDWLQANAAMRSLPATSWPSSIAKRLDARVSQVVEDHFRPEMRRMERALLLQILDSAWKEHLLAMDHLRVQRRPARLRPGRSQGRVQARRHAAVRQMWSSVGNYVTDLIFKMEQLDEGFVGSTWVEVASDQGRRHAGQRNRTATAGRHRRHRGRQEARADPQPRPESRPQRPLPLRQRQEVQELLHAQSVAVQLIADGSSRMRL